MGGEQALKVFVSYRRVEADAVQPVIDALSERAIDVWVDTTGIERGVDWWSEISAAIVDSDIVIAALTAEYHRSTVCRDELEFAHANGKRVLPVVIGNFDPPDVVAEESWPPWLFYLNWIRDSTFASAADLAAEIDRLAWLDHSWTTEHRELLRRASNWDRHGRPRSQLMRGRDVTASERSLSVERPKGQAQPTELQRAYVMESRRSQRRLRAAFTTIAAVVTVVSIVLAAVALKQSSEAAAQRSVAEGERDVAEQERATAQRQTELAEQQRTIAVAELLASQALLEARIRPDKSLALAVASNRLVPDASGEDALLRVLPAFSAQSRVARLDENPVAVALAPGGRMIAVGDQAGSVRLFDLLSDPGDAVIVHELGTGLVDLAFSHDGQLVVGTDGGELIEYAPTGDRLVTISSVQLGSLEAFAVAPTRDSVVAGGVQDESARAALLSRSDGLRVGARIDVDDFWVVDLAAHPATGEILVGTSRELKAFTPDLEPASVSGFPPAIASSFIETEAIAVLEDGSVAVGGNPSETADRSGVLTVYRMDGSTYEFGFPRSVVSVEACGLVVYYGTRGGDVGMVTGDRALPITSIGEPVADLACGPDGELVVAGADGLLLRYVDAFSSSDGPTFRAFELPLPETAQLLADGASISLTTTAAVNGSASGLIDETESSILRRLFDDAALVASTCLNAGGEQPLEGSISQECAVARFDPTGSSARIEVDGSAYDVPDTSRQRTYSVAVSEDRSRVFVGGGLEGSVLRIRPGRPVQELWRLPSWEFFVGAAFFADGDALLTVESGSPYWEYGTVRVHVVGGAPLERLACEIGGGTLADTVATELLPSSELARLEC